MYDCCVESDRLRTVMSSIMRRRRGLIVARAPVLRGSGCDDPHPLRQETSDQQLPGAGRATTPAQRVCSIAGRKHPVRAEIGAGALRHAAAGIKNDQLHALETAL